MSFIIFLLSCWPRRETAGYSCETPDPHSLGPPLKFLIINQPLAVAMETCCLEIGKDADNLCNMV